MTGDFDARFPEFDMLMDVGCVSGTTVHFESDQSVDIDFSITPRCGDPVRRQLANDLALHDGTLWLEPFRDAFDVASPCTFGATK